MAQPPVKYHQGDARQFWPRKAALRIAMLDKREDMLQAIDDVPEKFREWVKDILNIWINQAGGLTNLKAQIQANNLKRENKY